MKLRVLIIIIALLTSAKVFSQVKPTLMVFPSDNLLSDMGYGEWVDDMGAEKFVRHYQKALLNNDLKSCITKIEELFSDRDFNLVSLQYANTQNTGRGNRRGTSVVTYDVRLELEYEIVKQGPRDILNFKLRALDAYSGEPFSTVAGESAPAIGATTASLLYEAVIDKFDKFAEGIQRFFDNTNELGRLSRLYIEATEEVVLPKGLKLVVETWLKQNCVNGQFQFSQGQNGIFLEYKNARMPILAPDGSNLDASNFYQGLVDVLSAKYGEYNVELMYGIDFNGSDGGNLGDAFIQFSQKE